MDAHFDTTHYHPTFLQSGVGDVSHHFHNISMDSFLAQAYEHNLSSDTISHAVGNAYDFFKMTPGIVLEGEQTAMSYGNPSTFADDVLTINRNELLAHGIHDKSTLSLICTHELTHAITQELYSQGEISPWQSELISDKFMGFRAAIEGLDINGVLKSLEGQTDSPSHPGEDLRKEHIIEAQETLKEMLDQKVPCDFQTLLKIATDQISADPDIQIRELASHQKYDSASGNTSAMYSKEEINSHIKEQEDKIEYLKNLIQRNEREKAERIKNGQPYNSNDYTIGSAKVDLENAKKSLASWQCEKSNQGN